MAAGEKSIRFKKGPGFFRVSLFLIGMFFVMAAGLPGQVRAVAYELYREALRINMEFKARNMSMVEGEHFTVRYGEEDAPYARVVLDSAEKFYAPVALRYGFNMKKRITVVVYPDREALNASFGWSSDESAMGVYWGGVIRVLSPAWWSDEDMAISQVRKIYADTGPMAHELTHLVVDYATRGNCPRWFTEGIAQMEEYKLTGFLLGDAGAPGEGYYSLANLDREFDRMPDQGMAYREAFSAVEYIEKEYGEEKLLEIIGLLGRGLDMGAALNEALGSDLEGFERKWRMWSGF